MYETKPLRKLFSFQKVDTNNLRSKFLNFTQEILNSSPITYSVNTNRRIIQHNLYAAMDTTVSWKLCHESDTCNGLALGSSTVCKKEIDSTVELGNTRMLYIGIIFVSVEIKWLRWNKKLTMPMLTTQSVTDLLNNQYYSGHTLNCCEQKTLASRNLELKQYYVP